MPQNPDWPRDTKQWEHNFLKGILQNFGVTGQVKVDGLPRPRNHPVLIDPELFEKCQQVRILNRRRKIDYVHNRHHYPLAGLLICGACGAPMHGRTQVDRGNIYYKCYGRLKGQCRARWIPGAGLENLLRFDLSQCLPDEKVDPAGVERLRAGLAKTKPGDPERTHKNALRDLDRREARVKRMFELEISDESELKADIARIAAERKDIERRAGKSEQTPQEWYEERILDLVRAWDAADGEHRGEMLAEIYERIEVYRTGKLITMAPVPRERWKPFFRRVVGQFGPGSAKTERLLEIAAGRGNADVRRESHG